MAKLSAHGDELCRIEYIAKRFAVMSDGTILQNHGDGWKVRGTVKPGIDPREFANKAVKRFDESLQDRPHYAAYRNAMIKAGSLYFRSVLVMYLNNMPGDPDGIYSELDDSFDHRVKNNLSIDDIAKLDRLARLATREGKEG